MNILIFDTSTYYCSATLKIGNRIISDLVYVPQRHNEYLLDIFHKLILRSGIKSHEIDILSCSLGPGSFVGIRLSVSLIQAISFMTDSLFIGFSSMFSIAFHIYKRYKYVMITVVLGAGVNDFYIGQYKADNHNSILSTVFEKRISHKNLLSFIIRNDCGIIVGRRIEGIKISFDIEKYIPNSSHMVDLIYKKYFELPFKDCITNGILPTYLQRTNLHNSCRKF
jgi:tRNA threonylcarbamoyladenosine biosynthesis protein TsaB